MGIRCCFTSSVFPSLAEGSAGKQSLQPESLPQPEPQHVTLPLLTGVCKQRRCSMKAALEIFTATQWVLLFGVASGILSLLAYIPYIVDTATRRIQPQRASWLIWSVLGSIALGSQIYEGASASLWFAGVQVSGTVLVFVLSIRVGSGKYLTRIDYVILGIASVGLLLWYFTETAAYALTITISISLLGGIATAVKAYRDPESETLITWVIFLIASVLAIFSVGGTDLILLAYPLYLFTLYLVFVLAILFGRARYRLNSRELLSDHVQGEAAHGAIIRPFIFEEVAIK